jgi:hypothetical protein
MLNKRLKKYIALSFACMFLSFDSMAMNTDFVYIDNDRAHTTVAPRRIPPQEESLEELLQHFGFTRNNQTDTVQFLANQYLQQLKDNGETWTNLSTKLGVSSPTLRKFRVRDRTLSQQSREIILYNLKTMLKPVVFYHRVSKEKAEILLEAYDGDDDDLEELIELVQRIPLGVPNKINNPDIVVDCAKKIISQTQNGIQDLEEVEELVDVLKTFPTGSSQRFASDMVVYLERLFNEYSDYEEIYPVNLLRALNRQSVIAFSRYPLQKYYKLGDSLPIEWKNFYDCIMHNIEENYEHIEDEESLGGYIDSYLQESLRRGNIGGYVLQFRL